MDISRRAFFGVGSAAVIGVGAARVQASQWFVPHSMADQWSRFPATYAVIPVVSDGKWIWKDPPSGQRGYLEPREFEYTSGIHITGRGVATDVGASTVAPVSFPEQQILDCAIETIGCEAEIVQVSEGGAQLLLSASQLAPRQTISAIARYRLRICKAHQGYAQNQFPNEQNSRQVFGKQVLAESPGIQFRIPQIKQLVAELVSPSLHPWEQAKAFHHWVWENIEGVPGRYTSVKQAIIDRKGDCEERATVFIALCRAAGIPARLVWVPSHHWAEFGLHDHDRMPHWIPVHTAAYSWFGWTGAHEVVLQKGDRIRIEHRKRTMRLIDDWWQLNGPRPETYFSSTVTPIATAGNSDAGPGARKKLHNGQWELAGGHPADRYMRDK